MSPSSAASPRAVLLVEGRSDRAALLTLAARLDLDLVGVEIVEMGGITNLGRHLQRVDGRARVVLLHDAGEAADVARTLARHPRSVSVHVCEADLEDELIRALGLPAVLAVVEKAGDLPAWHILLNQPHHRGRPPEQVMRRFLGTTSGRKERYAALLVDALDLDRAPAPMVGALSVADRPFRPDPS